SFKTVKDRDHCSKANWSISCHLLLTHEADSHFLHQVLSKGRQLKQEMGEPVVIGGMVLDIHATPSIPANPRTTTPGRINYALGGVARNVAECMSKLGTKPYMISALGLDMAGNLLLEHWKSAGLPTEGIRKHQYIETPVICNILDVNGEVAAGVAGVEAIETFLTPEWIQQFKCKISSSSILMVDANLNPPALEVSCKMAAESNTPVWFEPVSVAKSRRIASVAKYITLASPNEDELVAMANTLSGGDIFHPIERNDGRDNSSEFLFQMLKPAIWVLLEKGIKTVIVTLGSDGVFLCSKGGSSFKRSGLGQFKPTGFSRQLYEIMISSCPPNWFSGPMKSQRSSHLFAVHLPALPASVVRLIGAGDCLVGGTIASICAGLDVMRSVAVGIAAAKAAVESKTNVPPEFRLATIAEDQESPINSSITLKVKVTVLSRPLLNLLLLSLVAPSQFALSLVQFRIVMNFSESPFSSIRSLRDGLIYQVQSLKAGFTPTILTSNQLIHLYSKHGLLHEAHKLFDEMPLRNVFSWNSIISAYIRSQNLTQARILFDSAAYRDLVTYNSMLSGYVSVEGYETHALSLFVEMQKEHDHIRIDEFTATTILNLFAKLSMESYGRQLHAFMVKTANDLSGFSVSSLVDMYSKCGCFKEAHNVFSGCGGVVDSVLKNAMVAACCREGEMEMALDLFWREPELNDAFSWNTLISGYAHNGYQEKALNLFVSMAKNGVRWNEQTFASVLNACSGLKSWKIGKEVHGWVLKNGMSSNPFISSGILDVYCKCGNMKYAELMHFACEIRNSFSICSLIVGHASQGNMAEARQLFNTLEEKNSVVWTALFSGYVKAQQSEAVFELLNEYRTKEAMTPDSLILISVLGACAIQAALDPGKQVHGYILRTDTEMDEKLISAMVDMYSKSGNITYAEKVFKLVTNRDSVLYNVMIAGYAHHGNEINAIQLFEDMLEKRIMPDAITFTALLSACRHCGLVQL
ncbi:PfkB domain-containing protein/PPR domain-containing protein/PPR_2 domain-containing protein, partial [Cephalotus follicularis]